MHESMCFMLVLLLHAHAIMSLFLADKTVSDFTGMISTSNHIMDDTVTVETDADVIWITETAL